MDRKQERIAKKIEKLLAKADLEAFSMVILSKDGTFQNIVAGSPALLIANLVVLDDYTKLKTEGQIKISYENAKKMARHCLGIDANY